MVKPAERLAAPTEYQESAMERAEGQAKRVSALLAGIESTLGTDRVGTIEFDSTLRNLLDLAREETAVLCQILEGE
jgi:hypothetical protein